LIAQAVNAQLVPGLLGDTETAADESFTRFDVDEKLRAGSFREEADAFSVASEAWPT